MSMRNRVTLGVGGGLLLAAGLALGVAAGPSLQALAAGSHTTTAKTTTVSVSKGDYCALYEQSVATNLNVPTTKLETANEQALQTVIKQMYADGKITQAQEQQALQEVTQYATNPCAALQAAATAHTGQMGAQGSQALTNARAALIAAVAQPLNLSTATLQSDLSAGKTVTQLITAQHANAADVQTAYLNAAQTQLTAVVKSGAATQAQADLLTSYLKQAVAAGHYPLLDKDSAGAMGAMGAMGASGLPASFMAGQ